MKSDLIMTGLLRKFVFGDKEKKDSLGAKVQEIR